MNFIEVSEQIEKSDQLDFGSIFSRSIELFKKVWLQGFITLLLTFITMIPFYIIFYLPMLFMGLTDPEVFQNEEFPAELILPLIVLLPILILGVMSVGLLLNAAFLRICRQKDLNMAGTESYFYYFKKEFVGKVMILSLMLLGLMILGMLTCGLGFIYLLVPISLVPAFLAFDEDLSAIEIVKSGFRLGNKNWLVIFGLIFVMGLLAELGVIVCFVGVLFTAMLAKIPVYFMYKDSMEVWSGG
ncbi:MAG: hypothetical protein KAJ23_05655 [Maribacter sp.]|nr:hypothetical protein [Maribacter sp.]